MIYRISMVGFILLGWATAVSGQESPLGIIPQDAGAALVVRNLKDLRAKANRAAGKIGKGDLDISAQITQVLNMAGFDGVVDETKALALLAVSSKSIGEPPIGADGFDIQKLLVLAIPFKDRDEIGAKVGLKRGELKQDQVQGINRPIPFLINFKHGYVRGNHFYIGVNEKAVKHAATAKRLSETLPDRQIKEFRECDMVAQMGTVVWGAFWNEILKNSRRVLGARMDAAEKEMGEKIVKSMEGIRFGLVGLRLEEEGVGLTLFSAWEKENKNVQEILELLRFGDTPTDLRGLPAGNVLVAEAAKGNGVANAMLARVLFKAALQDLLGTQEITTVAERPLIVGIFNEVWYNLLGNKIALYQNPDTKKHGKLALVALLDTADGKKFFEHFAHLAKVADGNWKPAGKDVEQLVADLSGKDRRRHELALLKLRLLGEEAAPVLAKAAAHEALAEQVNLLRTEIKLLAEERRQDLPAQKWILGFRPTLELLLDEERAGAPIHVMKMKFSKQAGDLPKQLEALFGPDWDKIRFAVHNKNVVMLMGSNIGLLDEALNNLKENKPGLAQKKYLQGFSQKSGLDRRVEFHLATGALMALYAGNVGAPADAKNERLSSISLSVQSDNLQLDIWTPYDEVRLLSKVFGL